MNSLPPASDPCWSDAAFRTSRLQGVKALYDLTNADIAELTNVSIETANHWVSGRHKQIHAAHLRALLYDLLAQPRIKSSRKRAGRPRNVV